MPDKKLTDSEIVKALECCNNNNCKECPYGKYNTSGWCCMPKLRKDTLDLINRQQAENERLQEAIDEQDIEISRLYKRIDEAKAEAYKECIEKVRKSAVGMHPCSDELRVFDSDLDNLLKELVGDGDV